MNNEFNEKNLSDQSEEQAVAEEVAAQSQEDVAKNAPKVKKSGRHLKYGSMAVISTVLVVVVALIIGVLADALFERFPLSIDMTKDDKFSISEQTQDVIASIKKPVEIIAFFPESTISKPNTGMLELDTVYKEMYQVLKEYESGSKGNVTVSYVDLAANPTQQTVYKAYGTIAEGDVLMRCGKGEDEKFRRKNILNGDFYTVAEDSYRPEGYTFSSTVEATLASMTNAVISDEDREIAVLTGHEENEYTVAMLTSLYEDNGYAVSQVNLATDQKIGDRVKNVIIAAPKTDLSDDEVTRLREWLDNDGKLGRNLMVVVNYEATVEDCPNLYEFLDVDYQIEVADNWVVETDDGRKWRDELIYADLPESPIQKTASESSATVMYPRQILLKGGTDNTKSLFNVPLVNFSETARVKAMGNESEAVEAEETPIVGMGMAVKWAYDNDVDEQPLIQTNVIVANQGMIVMETYNNKRVTLDIMNYVNGNEDGVDILNKDMTSDLLDPYLTQETADTLGVILTFVLPGLVLVLCLVVFFRRRHL